MKAVGQNTKELVDQGEFLTFFKEKSENCFRCSKGLVGIPDVLAQAVYLLQ